MRKIGEIGVCVIGFGVAYNIGWRTGYNYNFKVAANADEKHTEHMLITYPEEWDMEARGQLIDVPKDSAEYKALERKMTRTVVSHGKKKKRYRVIRIQRYQNKSLWRRYAARRHAVAEENSGNPNELLLFHGTDNLTKILEQGFDFRLANDGMFGKGTYFAENSSKSNLYIASKGKTKKMLICRVALGRPYVVAYAWKFLRPPKKDESLWIFWKEKNNFHSILGDSKKFKPTSPLNYREFVIYHTDQAYPQYVVEYRII